jgi:hypothetical protein
MKSKKKEKGRGKKKRKWEVKGYRYHFQKGEGGCVE